MDLVVELGNDCQRVDTRHTQRMLLPEKLNTQRMLLGPNADQLLDVRVANVLEVRAPIVVWFEEDRVNLVLEVLPIAFKGGVVLRGVWPFLLQDLQALLASVPGALELVVMNQLPSLPSKKMLHQAKRLWTYLRHAVR